MITGGLGGEHSPLRSLVRPPPYLVGGHAQTIWPALRFGGVWPGVVAFRERWTAPDGDFVEVDRVLETPRHSGCPAPLLVLFHGLEGSFASHYVQAFAAEASKRGFDFALPHFRGCSGSMNLAPRAYHSGDHSEVDWILGRFKAEAPLRPVLVVGVSLGGNALMRWTGEHGTQAAHLVAAVAAISSPLDLVASGHAMGRGFNLHVYTRMFLKTMRIKALQKWRQYPGLFDRERVAKARNLYEFDDVFTAPLHGFANAEDYWTRASAKPVLASVAVPSLLLNALNDPFVPRSSLPTARDVAVCVTLWQPQEGGHVGFPSIVQGRAWDFHVHAMPSAVIAWLSTHLPVQLPDPLEES